MDHKIDGFVIVYKVQHDYELVFPRDKRTQNLNLDMTSLLNDLNAADNITKEPNHTNVVEVETKPRGGMLRSNISIRRDASKGNDTLALNDHSRIVLPRVVN